MSETREQIDNNDHFDLVINKTIWFKRSHRFSVLHKSVLYDKQLENIRKAFKDKYSIDYLAIFWIELDNTGNYNNYFMENMNHNVWRDYLIKQNLAKEDPILSVASELPKGKGKLIFPDVEGFKAISQRGDIIGEYKNPFDICMHSNISNIIWGYSITLQGLTSILSITYETYVQLRRDLQKIEPFLMPFYNYFKEFGSITDTLELKHKLKDHNFNFII